MKRVLIVIEDEKDILDSIKEWMQKAGFEVIGFSSGEEFLQEKIAPEKCVYLIDWNLPGVNGLEITKLIRAKDKISPIFILSANQRDDQILDGLKSGADDYITKPFRYEELKIKISNALNKMDVLHANLMNVGLKFIPEAHSVMKDGVTVQFTAREFIIFKYLYSKNNVVSREELIDQFHKDLKMTSRNIDVHVFSLRKKINKINLVIETVWGSGYKLNS
jgi:DNA-binding response OmpR family regulator